GPQDHRLATRRTRRCRCLDLRAFRVSRSRLPAAQLHECISVDELQRFARGKGNCIPREAIRGNEDATVGALCCHDAEELPDTLDGNLSIQPVLALDDDSLASADQFQVNSTISLVSSALSHEITLLAVGFADQEFKVRPGHLSDRGKTRSSG